MVSREEYLQAIELVHHDLVEVLKKWMFNERGNLLDFLSNPEGHVLYNQFVIPDTVALQARAEQLEFVVEKLTIVLNYKNGDATKVQCDNAIDSIPYVLLERLLVWMKGRQEGYIGLASGSNTGSPISEYDGLISFNTEAFLAQVQMYGTAIVGVKTMIDYKKGLLSPVEDDGSTIIIGTTEEDLEDETGDDGGDSGRDESTP